MIAWIRLPGGTIHYCGYWHLRCLDRHGSRLVEIESTACATRVLVTPRTKQFEARFVRGWVIQDIVRAVTANGVSYVIT